MMYGFGDEFLTRPDSVKLMEEMVIEYITGLAAKVRRRSTASLCVTLTI